MIKISERFFLKEGIKSAVYLDLTESVVLTNDSLLNVLLKEFTTKDDKEWCGGKGKKYFLQFLRKHLLKENRYFNKHPKKMRMDLDRYCNFCNDTIIYSVLRFVVKGIIVTLVHPSEYQSVVGESPCVRDQGMPDLIPGIPVVEFSQIRGE